MKFPYSEAEVVVLAEAMISGYSAHAADFPSVDLLSLGTSLTDYKTPAPRRSSPPRPRTKSLANWSR